MSGIGRARVGSVMAMVGKVLLWMDLLLVAFVYDDVRSGSHVWVIWVSAEAVLGLALLAVGSRLRAREMARTSRETPKAA